MKIHEYQAKEVLRKYGVPTPQGVPCFSVDEAVKAAQAIPSLDIVFIRLWLVNG